MKKVACDVALVGGGIAGITAALELLNLNKKVAIFDRDIEENFGGLAKESFGGMFFVDTPQQRRAGIKDSPELALKDWLAVAKFNKDDIWPQKWAETYVYNCTQYVYKWLRKQGVKYFPVVHWVERGLFTPGNSYPRFHIVWGTGFELSEVLRKKLISHPLAEQNLQLFFRHKVERILITENTISGIGGTDETNGESFEIEAGAVVVATGGIGGNLEMVRKHWYKPWGTPPEVILNGAHKYGLGDMHEEVAQKNGKITHLDKMWPYAAGVHHPKPTLELHGLSLVPPKSALWLNFKGERMGPMPLITAYDTRYIVEQICKQEKKFSWQVLNLKIAIKEFAISGAESNEAMKNKNLFGFLRTILFGNKPLVNEMIATCQDFVVADTIEELAAKMNNLTNNNDVDVENLRSAINNYDDNIKRGPKYFNDDQLRRIAHTRSYRGDKVRTSKFQTINDPKAGPLIAIREFILSRKTLGGIQTNLDCAVIDNYDQPISGLYAIGEAAGFGGGGMHGQGSLEGTFLGGCVLTARIAAHAIVGEKLITR